MIQDLNHKLHTDQTSPDKATAPKQRKKEHPIVSIVLAIIFALLFRSFAYEPFNIPSGSMKPTLLIGDYIFVSKYSYGYSRYSFPLGLPLFQGRLLASEPKRGDVVVFRLPSEPSTNYIKRLIGLPGDTVQVRNGILYINDQEIPKILVDSFTETLPSGEQIEIAQYEETLPNGVSYRVLDERHNGALDNTQTYVVPAGHYFMMGDNRDNSQDSRVTGVVGMVPEENLVGPARRIFFSSNSALWKFWDYRSDRYFKYIGV